MIQINTMRYGTDTFSFNKSGLIRPKQALDCTALNVVNGFTITGNQPNGTDRRVVFGIDGSYKKIAADGTISAVATQSITADSVLEEGNTVAELQALTAIPSFAGKSVTPVIALYAPPEATTAEEMPTLKISIKGTSIQDQPTKVEQSPEYTLANEDIFIANVIPNVTTTSGGTVLIEASLFQRGAWSDYLALADVKNQNASAVKFKATYAVTTIGVSSAKINSLSITHKSNNASVSGEKAELISTTQNFSTAMGYVRCLVKHSRLKDATIKAYCSFRDKPNTREMYPIGTGTGERQTITLPDACINHNSLQIYIGKTQNNQYEFNMKTNQVTLTATEGESISASYSYGWADEVWQEMLKGSTQQYLEEPTLYSTNFSFALDNDLDAKSISALKIVLEKTTGTVTEEALGIATGSQQIFVLSHRAKADTIVIPGASFSIDENNILTVVAPKGTELKVSYKWVAETTTLRGFLAAWNQV